MYEETDIGRNFIDFPSDLHKQFYFRLVCVNRVAGNIDQSEHIKPYVFHKRQPFGLVLKRKLHPLKVFYRQFLLLKSFPTPCFI